MPQALAIHDLHKVYPNGKVALRGISLEVAEGDFYALLGPNGAGKSTTIGIVTSLVRKTAGRVEVFGHDIDRQFSQAKACIGLVPQEFNFNIFEKPIDILLNQAGYYGVERRRACARAEALLEHLGLWDARNQPARFLSGGMKRRLIIARALVHDPRLLILDEPTAGVDIELRRTLWRFLREINAAGTTIILTTHYLEEAETLCRNIGIIDHGRLIENTSMRRLLAKLHVETFVLDLAAPVAAPPVLPGYTVRRIDETCLEVDVPKDKPLNRLFAELDAAGIQVVSLRNKVNRLEELFVRLVGEGRAALAEA
ncbi:MAG: ABC transporter ATP-binding protein [Gammaproteobacteria bacterium]|nr:MAG: ABC transporter ATP-binding protein [Gammaproteobacteria bacterium]